tara:strand:+ start:706 stop:942 length:237 start_codon:yes stop_codon:yes gene_type:complete
MPTPYFPSEDELRKIADTTHVPGLYVVARKRGIIHGGERAEDASHAQGLTGSIRTSFGECDEVIIIQRDDQGRWFLLP